MSSSLLQQVVVGHASMLHRFTTDEYHQLIEADILPEGAPIELIDGVILQKDRRDHGGDCMNHGTKHAYVVRRLQQRAEAIRQLGFHLQTQLPVAISSQHEPEPDGAVIRHGLDEYRDRLPTAADVVLVIEVADSSLKFDWTTKQRVYATAGIETYWIIDIACGKIDVFTKPNSSSGMYNNAQSFGRDETVRMSLDDQGHIDLAVVELLP